MSAVSALRLGVNIDHVATIRNARGGKHPDPVRAAKIAIEAGADGITAHLREDRRHISDDDIARLKATIAKPLNLEMAATDEMVAIALRTRPHAACLVPERRAERTTEGGLDVVGGGADLGAKIGRLRDAGIRVSLFIAPDPAQIREAAARKAGYRADAVLSSLMARLRTLHEKPAQATLGFVTAWPIASECSANFSRYRTVWPLMVRFTHA